MKSCEKCLVIITLKKFLVNFKVLTRIPFHLYDFILLLNHISFDFIILANPLIF